MSGRDCLNCALDDCFDCAYDMREYDEYAGCCCGRIRATEPDDEDEWDDDEAEVAG